MDFKKIISESVQPHIPRAVSEQEITSLIETPKYAHHGDFSFPCFQLAAHLKSSPVTIAESLAKAIRSPYFKKVENIGPYVNFFFNPATLSTDILLNILSKGSNYGSSTIGKGETIVLDMSSPNIAKPFSMGHLRSTVIGNSLSLLAEKCGYQTVKNNYIGDWGTQFGKLVVAYKKWGDRNTVKKKPIDELFSLYTKFHVEASQFPELEDEAREVFKSLEDGNQEYLQLWGWFRKESLQAFQQLYTRLGISFDSYRGESYYNDKMDEVITMLEEENILVKSDGAMVVKLTEEALPPCLIQKRDGATLYATRDLAAALDRFRSYSFSQALYVVGQEQRIHFQQVFAVLSKLGFTWASNMHHIPFGLYLKNGKKMSTRKGHVILLEDMLNEAVKLAHKNMIEKNPDLPNANEIAEQVGVGALIYHDLKNERTNSVEFSMEDMLTFEGDTGPYLQYTFARASSLQRKGETGTETILALDDDESWGLVKKLHAFPEIIHQSQASQSPHYLAKYLFETAQSFNKYYGKVRILEQDAQLTYRLTLVSAFTTVLAEGLRLLGIKAPENM
ncbi:arginine--tRNA ligase [Bacillus spongiae]|uniref:Arginine--tRNA ligase n=1 Tax=Bacillus spongiae TaxID=2683610 RepID=A0ABU8HJR9_9BACI